MGSLGELGQERLHPRYREHATVWEFFHASYLGGEAWTRQGKTFEYDVVELAEDQETESGGYRTSIREEQHHLWRHPRELDWEYRARRRMATYHNFVEPFVDVQARQVLRDVQGPEGLPPALEPVRADMDLRGSSLQEWRGALVPWAMVFGHVFVLVDRPEVDGAENRAQEVAKGGRAYAQIVLPLDLLDWCWDEKLYEFEWAKIRVRRPRQRELDGSELSDVAEAREPVVTRTYSRDGWVERVDGKETDSGKGLEFVPLVPVFAKRNPLEPEPIGLSLVRDVAYFARSSYNKLSWLTDQEAKQCFNQLVLKTTRKISPKLREALGTGRYITSEGGADFVAPDTGPMAHLLSSMREDERRAETMLGGSAVGDDAAAGVESASALLMRHEDEAAVLSGLAASLEEGEGAVWRAIARVEGVAEWEPKVRYNRDYSQAGRLGRADMIVKALPSFSGPAAAALKGDLLRALLPGLDPERLAELVGELEQEQVAQEQKEAQQLEVAAAAAEVATGAGEEQATPERAAAVMPGEPAVVAQQGVAGGEKAA